MEYSDLPEGFQVQGNYSDLPEGFSVAPKEKNVLETIHNYIDPVRVLSGKAGTDTPVSAIDIANTALMALPAGKGPVVAPTAEMLHGAGGAGYKVSRMSPVSLSGSKVDSFISGLKAGLKREGFYPHGSSAQGTHAILDDIKPGGTFMPGGDMTVADYIAARQALQKQAQTFSAPKDQRAATVAIERLDNLFDKTAHENFVGGTPAEIDAIRSTIKDARANFAAGYRSDLLTAKQHKAELQTAAANSGRNLDNKLRQATAGILTSPKSAQGFNPAETAAMEKIVEGVPGANATRFVGNLLGGGGGLGAVVTGGLAGAGAGAMTANPLAIPLGVAAPATGVALKAAENALTRNAMTKLANATRLRSPLGATAKAEPFSKNALVLRLLSLQPYLAGNQ